MVPSRSMLATAPPVDAESSPDEAAVTQELQAGLLAHPAHIEPKYLYDSLGSSLFTAITQLPEYYPTRCEAEILGEHAAGIARHVGAVDTLIDLGAGDCAKAERLFGSLRPQRYVPIDISADYLQAAVRRLEQAYPQLRITALGLDFHDALTLPGDIPAANRLFFYPGSSIGNLDPGRALALLSRVRAACQGGGLLVGVDRIKPRSVLEPAYDDALHLTAAFNLNMLRHVNHLLGSNFDVRQWSHVARYDEHRSRIEMHLQALSDVLVSWPGAERRFASGERIHTESSYKYSVKGFHDLLTRAGYTRIQHWSDSRDWFSVFSARA
ncbi:L-histidine N(alpha)-methyltransferase [Bordetella petrii]|uniref:L-histidine N(alpha)-methyltransferase n=1 Tax=Bordetella petrii TaxID=94624 RepID=UPI001E5C69B1|nr:L-histidine N(alpha)-methyltransferase [Bordetella petrii]MCD0504024.1 L-histidine N(alpha)-methyltransferase [Bordetella petrii]